MKTLILVRHSKSSHSYGVSSDFDRPLNDRGFRDAADMGKNLFKRNIVIDQFVSSPALRAKTTAELFAAEYDRKMKDILLIPALYHANPESFSDVILGLNDELGHIAIFSHNPGITDYASSLCSTHIEHMPTSSVFAVNADITSWNDFSTAKKNFMYFYTPA